MLDKTKNAISQFVAHTTIRKFVRLNLAMLVAFTSYRAFELAFLEVSHSRFSIPFLVIAKSFFITFLQVLQFAAVFFLLFLALENLRRGIGSVLHYFVVGLLGLLWYFLFFYYWQTDTLLDHVIYTYSQAELRMAFLSSGGTAWAYMAGLTFFAVFNVMIYKWFSRIVLSKWIIMLFLALAFLAPFLHGFSSVDANFTKHGRYYGFLSTKIDYFLTKSFIYWQSDKELPTQLVVEKAATQYQTATGGQYTSWRYPFWRMDDTTDVLSPFFQPSENPPNVVYIIVESLSAVFGGSTAGLASFTPFLDSLATQSLYWPNTLSTSERTFGVLPSVLGSLPYGFNGFTNLDKAMPQHQSTLKILIDQGYDAAFVYGGWAGFDRMEGFMLSQGVDKYPVDYKVYEQEIEPKISVETWGYDDAAMFNMGLEFSDSLLQPYVQVYLTLSLHAPFWIPDVEKYDQMLEKHLKLLKPSEDARNKILQYEAHFRTMLFVDDAIRQFFEKYRKRNEFANTIFVITGDHRMGPIPHRDKLDKFRVPLLIYSPLLKRTANFECVATHQDIAPSLNRLLSVRYGLPTPQNVHYLGQGLDTSRNFRINRSLALMGHNKAIDYYLDDTLLLAQDKLYRVKNGLNVTAIDNEEQKSRMTKKLEQFKTLNSYVCTNNMLMPNDYELPVSQTEKLISETLSFDSWFNFDSKIDRTTNAYKGRYSFVMDSARVFYSLLSDYPLADSTNGLMISGEYFINCQEKRPALVLELRNDKDEQILWHQFDATFRQMPDGQWFQLRFEQRFDGVFPPNTQIRLHFWNKHENNCLIDEISYSVIRY